MHLKRLNCFMLLLILNTAVLTLAAEPVPFKETPAQHDAKMQWFREAHFGMFIHWGLYSQLAGEWKDKTIGGGAEWIQNRLNIPSSQYSALAKTWNPSKYDPVAWVKLMKAAGVKYIVITSKHHDGFCLWPTKCNDDWNISITPGGKDLLKPLAEACRQEDVRFCLYHSIPDWHHADWPARPAFNDYATGTADKERYKHAYLFPQLKELLTNYGHINLLWLDDGGMARPPVWNANDGQELEDYIHDVDPKVILDDRSQAKPFQQIYGTSGAATAVGETAKYANHAGDYITPEGTVPATGLPGIDWETCQTMQLPNNWGYNRLVGFRSFSDLLRQLVDVTSKGGNMLLNVGPTAEGEILPQARQCLEKFAAWMAINSEAIHGTTASPFDRLPFDGRCTQKPGKLYLHIFKWPADARLAVPVKTDIKRAYLLAMPEQALVVTTSDKGCQIALPVAAPDPIATVVVLEYQGSLAVVSGPPNLALGKPVEVSSVWTGREKELAPGHITDRDPGTSWAAEEKARSAWVVVDLQAPCMVTEAMLSDAPYGRTMEFNLEAQVEGTWKKLASGTTIGEGLHLNFSAVRAQRFRLNITKASDTPTLAEFQIFGK